MENTGKQNLRLLLEESRERLKELSCINRVTSILKEGMPVGSFLHQIVMILPEAWQYPEFTVSRIVYEDKEYVSRDFRETSWSQKQKFRTIGGQEGVIEVFYTRQFPRLDEGPFLKEERHLLETVCSLIEGRINSALAGRIIAPAGGGGTGIGETSAGKGQGQAGSRQLLQRFLNRHNAARDLYYDLMPFSVKEILLVATLYDAYSIEKEGRFSEHMQGETQSGLPLPRVTGVSNLEEAVARLGERHYDMAIVMMGADKQAPLVLAESLRETHPYMPVFLLLTDRSDVEAYEKDDRRFGHVDRVFFWNGNTRLFFSMVKLLEDHVNVSNDTARGFTRVILLVEDSPAYYSRYLPGIYSIVLEQTRHLIEDVNADDNLRMLKLRGRPKILLATGYEEAVELFDRYRDYLLCVITDVTFPRGGKEDPLAGAEFTRYVREKVSNIPVLLQSADTGNEQVAHKLRASFLNKNSGTLMQDLKSFITYYLGFGHFVYRDSEGRQIAVAKSMREFESYLRTVPEESLVYHAVKNHFSLWLMARGEVKLAGRINAMNIADYSGEGELRSYLVSVISEHLNEQERGKIVSFEEPAILEESNIVSFAPGSLGGKGRGLAFASSLIYDFRFPDMINGINIRTPLTGIVGTEEFDIFLELNKFSPSFCNETDYATIRRMFVNGRLSYNLEKKLRKFLKLVKSPIAIRSSSLFEDSLMQPFSGIFDTYMLPNNHSSFDVRLQQAMDAIKLVYASVYSDSARAYFESIDFKIEEEKMAIVLQEVAGTRHDDVFYPHISGTAQSYNFYPVAHMKPEEGFAVAAVGLGYYVMEGEQAYRFSPSYPGLEISAPSDIYRNSQLEFYAVNLSRPDVNLMEGQGAGLIRLDISQAEKHGNLVHCASVYDMENDSLVAGLDRPGPRVINFANILKYDYIPLSKTLSVILDVVREALGCPVEIEFAVDLSRSRNDLPSFYLLQIKPLFGSDTDYNIDEGMIKQEDIIIRSGKTMGNGVVNDLSDVIYVVPGTFDKMMTREIAREIEDLNSAMARNKSKYILIGPGRWGTRDRFIGIPVTWPQISNAAVIVEMSMEGFPLNASLGSHFFHNLTSMNVGYLSVNHSGHGDILRIDMLEKGEVLFEGRYVKHVRFSRPLQILLDGKKGLGLIIKQESKEDIKNG